MGVKSITKHLNERRLYTRTGGRWGIGAMHRMPTRTSYIGVHEFNRRTKNGANKPDDQVIGVEVPRLIAQDTWDRVQELLRSRNPKVTPPIVVARPTLLTGICFCVDCGGAMTIRTGKSGRYRYYACSIAARQGATGCKGRSIPMEKLDRVVTSHLEERLLDPERLEAVLGVLLDRREDRAPRKRARATEMRKRAAEPDGRLKRLYDAIESGIADLGDEAPKERIAELRAIKSQAQADAKRAAAEAETIGPDITPSTLTAFAAAARCKLRGPDGRFRRDHLRALAQRVAVDERGVRIMGSRSELPRQLAIANGVATAAGGVPRPVPKWRAGNDEDGHYVYAIAT